MAQEAQLHYFCRPCEQPSHPLAIEFATVPDFLTQEPAVRMLWELIDTQFQTRSKFLAIWRTVSFVAWHRDSEGQLDGFCLISAPVNWQVDYVVVRPDARGQGIASALVRQTVHQAALRGVPYLMLTSKASLRPLYESCGFEVIGTAEPVLQSSAT